MAFSPTEQCLATGDQKGALAIHRISDGGASTNVIRARPHQQHIHSIAFCMDRPELLLTGSDSSTIRITNFKRNPQEHLTLGTFDEKHKGAINSAVFSRRGDIAVSAARDGHVKVWDVMNRRLLKTLSVGAGEGWVDKVAFFPNVYNFATNNYSHDVTLWNVSNTGNIVRTTVCPNDYGV